MTYSIKNESTEANRPEASIAVLAVDGSPSGGGRTRAAIEAVAAAAQDAGGRAETIGLAEGDGPDRVLLALDAADAIIIGAPVYRAAAAAPLKQLLDLLPRDNIDRRSPLLAKPVVIVATGASLHHFLALDSLRNVLAGFFAAHVVPPGLYVPREGFDDSGALGEPYASQAAAQGAALVELARLIEPGSALASVRPQA